MTGFISGFHFHSLKLQMSLFVTLLFVVTTAIVGSMLIYSIHGEMRESLTQQQYDFLEAAANELDQEIDVRREALHRTAFMTQGAAMENPVQAQRFLADQAVLQGLFDRLHYFNLEGEPVATYPLDPDRPGVETADYGFVTPALHSGSYAISKPYGSIWRDEYLIFITEPVINGEGVITGALVGTLDVSRRDFIGALQETTIGKTGSFRLLTRNRMNIVNPRRDRVGEIYPPPGRDILLDRALGGWQGSEEWTSPEGESSLRSYKWLRNVDWLLEASLPSEDVFEPMTIARNRIVLWTIFFGLLTAPAVWFVTQRFLAPLSSLRDAIRACRENPEENIEASIVHKNEIGELAQEFNTMMSARRRAEQYARHIAHYDLLTGLPNRSVVEDRIAQAIKKNRRDGNHVAVMFLDLDHFKNVNDSAGHQTGDYVLMNVAARLTSCVREGDTVSRLSGDEFVIVMPQCESPSHAALLAARLIEVLTNSIIIGSFEFHVGASIGIAVFPEDGDDVNTLLRSADAAMYHAKEQGRSNYQFFTTAMNEAAQERVSMDHRLRMALEHGEFEAHYQIQVALSSREIIGLEALLRWNSPEGPVSPVDFIPIAENNGLIIPIGEWVLRESCKQAVKWRNAGHRHFTISVNVSARQFQGSDFADTVMKILAETGLEATALVLELTESVIMNAEQKNIATLERLAAAGVQLSLDDFGTGYSSLSYLKRLPLQKLKIDRSFIRDIHSDPDDAAIVRAILSIASSLELEVVAEGVETLEQVEFLQKLGCYSAQGYYFSRPCPAAQVDVLLKSGRKLRAV